MSKMNGPIFRVAGTRAIIQEECARRGISQGRLAKMWGISRQNLTNRIRRPTRNLAFDIAMEFDLSLQYVAARMMETD